MNERAPQSNDQPENVSRRFVLGGLAAAGISAVAGQAQADAPERSQLPKARPEDIAAKHSEARLEEKQKFYEDFAARFVSWNERVVAASELFLKDMETVVAEGVKPVSKGGPTQFEFLRIHLSLSHFEESAAAEIRRLMPALAVAESRLKPDAESGAGAVGFLQMMRSTFEEHGTGDIYSLENQLAAADSLFEQFRRTLENQCQPLLDKIEALFFNGDHAAFVKDFYVPCVLSCYNAGPGNVRSVLEGFTHEFFNIDDIHRYLSSNGIAVVEKDVFALMVQLEKEFDWDPQYGTQSRGYVPKVYAARMALDTDLSQEQRAHFLGELPNGSHPAVDTSSG